VLERIAVEQVRGQGRRAHRLDQVAAETGGLEFRQVMPLGRADQHDAAANIVAAQIAGGEQSARQRIVDQQRIPGLLRELMRRAVRDGRPFAVAHPNGAAGAPRAMLRFRSPRQSARACRQDREQRIPPQQKLVRAAAAPRH
jgi:hypothetical protein